MFCTYKYNTAVGFFLHYHISFIIVAAHVVHIFKKKNDNSPNIILSRPVELISDTEYQVSQNKKNAYIYSEIRIKTYRDICVLLVFPVVTFYLQRVRRKFESELKSSAFQTTKTSISTSCHPLCSHLNLRV